MPDLKDPPHGRQIYYEWLRSVSTDSSMYRMRKQMVSMFHVAACGLDIGQLIST